MSKKGIEVDMNKVRAILALVAPTNVREIRGFLGCVGYYWRFIEGYTRKAISLKELLKKDVEFTWDLEKQAAFEELKLTLAKAPILSPPEWTKECRVTLDASSWCLGAILWQYNEDRRECPVYYASKQMSPVEKKYTTTEREALTVVYACKKFQHYFLGYRIIFHTDHDSLKYLVNKSDLSGRIARWILLLQEFNYKVVIKSEKSNSNADFLSRQHGTEAVKDISTEFQFLNEFLDGEDRKMEAIFHLNGKAASKFKDIIDYLKEQKYPEGLTREE